MDYFALATGLKLFWFEANREKNQIDYKPDGSSTAIHASDPKVGFFACEAAS
jgi:hypothetical protein